MFYLQKIHSQVSRMGKSTACLLLWGYAHASPQNCLFWGPGFGTSFCSILRPLLATLLHPWVAEFAASILSLEDAKCEIASLQHLRAAYVQFKQWSNLLSGPVKQGNKVSLWRHSENRGENAGVFRAPFNQCWFVREEAEHTRISLAARVLNIAKLGSKGSQAEAHGIYKEKKRERKAPQPKARTESEEEAGRERCGQGTWSSRDYS